MRFAMFFLLLASTAAVPVHSAAPAVPNDVASITHALNRLAFGPRPGDIERVRAQGLARWIEEQLQPSRIDERGVEARLAKLTTIELDAATIARDYFLPAREARRAQQRAATGSNGQENEMSMRQPVVAEAARKQRLVYSELAEAKLLRAVYSERQLEEVLVDFWFNHFNVFARKGQTVIYVGEYEREAIRPHVFGKFRDLLGATAKSPAMLFYLDNWQSVAPSDARQPVNPQRPFNPRRPIGSQRPPNQPRPVNQQRPRGLNENYARELLELHTLGVDGGYTQQDIVNVARAFTGWTIGRPDAPGFRFAPNMHDRGSKTVLGHTLPAGGGIEDGERVLDLLAKHPSTARHIAFKLAQRFVSDTPPQTLVDRAAQTFTRTNGDLREVVRTVITSPELFAESARMSKVKTPFEFVASALRAADADIQNGQAILRALADMGMPLYLCQPPTGYDDTSETWVSSGALVTRINFAVALSRGEVRGVRLARQSAQTPASDPLQFGSAEFQKQ